MLVIDENMRSDQVQYQFPGPRGNQNALRIENAEQSVFRTILEDDELLGNRVPDPNPPLPQPDSRNIVVLRVVSDNADHQFTAFA